MKINGRLTEFPRARLRVEDDGQQLNALLFSDDPPQAIKDDYTGNSFYLRMSLGVPDISNLHVARWEHKARSAQREDSPFGIYLSGRKVQLQPYDVQASFAPGDQNTTIVHLWGQFLLWNNMDSSGLPQTVTLNAELPVMVESEAPATP